MITREDCFKVGEVAKTHNLQGEVVITTDSDLLEKYADEPVFLLLDGAPVPFFIALVILSLGMEMALAFSIANLNAELYSGSPPSLAATVIILAYFVNIAALLESCAAFLPAIVPCLPMETPPNCS